jgi:cytochrome bd-type quinol oxidase subunit 2
MGAVWLSAWNVNAASNRATNMYKLITIIFAAALILGVAWPMAFGQKQKDAAPEEQPAPPTVQRAPFTLVPQTDFSW